MHTPGPWKHRNGNTYFDKMGTLMTADLVVAPDHTWLAAVWQNDSVRTQEANARLIAAAPDLLAALMRLVDAGAPGETLQARGQARAAIAKALGT
jgi:hypothetical protein